MYAYDMYTSTHAYDIVDAVAHLYFRVAVCVSVTRIMRLCVRVCACLWGCVGAGGRVGGRVFVCLGGPQVGKVIANCGFWQVCIPLA